MFTVNEICVAGVYLIISKTESKFYVGESKNIFARWGGHISVLRRGGHDCEGLQFAYDKFGEDDLRFVVYKRLGNKRARLILEAKIMKKLVTKSYNVRYGNTIKIGAPEYNLLPAPER